MFDTVGNNKFIAQNFRVDFTVSFLDHDALSIKYGTLKRSSYAFQMWLICLKNEKNISIMQNCHSSCVRMWKRYRINSFLPLYFFLCTFVNRILYKLFLYISLDKNIIIHPCTYISDRMCSYIRKKKLSSFIFSNLSYKSLQHVRREPFVHI